MNFLHIHTSDKRGGAAISAYRFHQALLAAGWGSHILCGRKISSGDDSTSILPGNLGWVFNALAGKTFNNLGLQSFGYPSSFFLKLSPWIKSWADVIILKNPHGWYFSIGVLPWLAKKIPVIWRLPDMWALTGHCAYAYDCQRWKAGCGRCPDLFQYPELLIDNTSFLWRRKKRIYQKLKGRLVFVSPSRWLKKLLEESPLTQDFRCEYIPTAVDLNVFCRQGKPTARGALGIGAGEKVIMFSLPNLRDRKRKGVDLFLSVVEELRRRSRRPFTLLLLGGNSERLVFPSDVKLKKLSFISDDNLLASCYNAADVYLGLSRADNLPNTLVEAAACGAPAVTLNNGGCPEAVENGKTGYAVKDIREAAEAVEGILSDDYRREQLSLAARKFAEANFSMDLQVSRYVALAKQLIRLQRS